MAWLEWLNSQDGLLSGVAAVVSAFGASVAAIAAVVSIRRSQRRERSNLDFYVRASPYGRNGEAQPEVQIDVVNCGPAVPLMVSYGFDRFNGDSIPSPLAPSSMLRGVTEVPLENCREWCRFRASWLDPDGRKRRIIFWYRVEGDHELKSNSRKYLRVSRYERDGYHGSGPYYLRRWVPPHAYVGWQVRRLQFRRAARGANQSEK